MKLYTHVLLALAVGSLAQSQSTTPTAQPPLHTFPPVQTLTMTSEASVPTTGATSTDTEAGCPVEPSTSKSGTGSGSGSVATTGSSTSTGLAVPTGRANLAPVLGIAVAVLMV